MAAAMLSSWIRNQKLKAPGMKNAPMFYRNLEEVLDIRRTDHALLTQHKSTWKDGSAVDFCSNDFLSLGATGLLRTAFFDELARHPNFSLYSGGSRLMDGNYDYIEDVEQEIADFHGAETALIVGSGYEANEAIFSAIPRPGDAIVYDELVHSSIHDGMAHSLALCRVPFRHNDVDSFRDALVSVCDSQPLIRQGARSVIIAVESIYSMDGDVCPIKELVEVAREVFPDGIAQFFMDEAHSTGVLGPKGAGLIQALGLENEMAVRLHTCGKSLASTGAVILGNRTIRDMLMNFARTVIYTTACSFPMVASIRAGYTLMKTDMTKQAQENIQHLVKHFFKTISSKPIWDQATEMGILSIPLIEDWESRPFVTHVVPVWTKQRYNYWLIFHLQLAQFSTFPIDYPVVPKGKSRVRLTFHAANTESQVDGLVSAICDWAQEMVEIEKGGRGGNRVPKAARQVYASMADEDVYVNGSGTH